MLSTSNGYGDSQTVVASALRIISPNEVEGHSSLLGGWNKQTVPYTVFFYATTDRPAVSCGTWNGDVLHAGSQQQQAGVWVNSGGWLTFAASSTVVQLKIGISCVSEAAAMKDATAEITGFDFEQVHQQAVAAWEKAVVPIEIKGAREEDRRVFHRRLPQHADDVHQGTYHCGLTVGRN